ncbi:hypothetical protein [Fibrobacter sp.]|uniref:hypothetical protein n=1 Tax=Fibrobacter sp. TaxID=35828 RepID=UPI00388F239D
MAIEKRLVDEIESEFEELESMEVGSDKYRNTVDGLTKLVDRAIEIKKIDAEQSEKIRAQNAEEDFKRQQMQEDKKDRWIRNGIAAAGVVLPTLVTVWGALKTFQFEETGTVTTSIGRGFINKLLPKK